MTSPQVLDEEPLSPSEVEMADPELLVPESSPDVAMPESVTVLGLSLARIDMDGLVELVDRLIKRGRPSFFITANLHYAMLSHRDGRLAAVNRRAAFLVADGMPLVWYSRLKHRPLPQRVTGADAVDRLCGQAAERGYRVFLLGAAPEVARQAAAELCRRWPHLIIAGVQSPEFSALSPEGHARLMDDIRRARPDLIFVALGQPKGELWLDEHVDSLGGCVCVQIGAALDFIAGRVVRAPRWVQRIGAEWFFRITREPRRMIPRYAADTWFLLGAILRDAVARWRRPA